MIEIAYQISKSLQVNSGGHCNPCKTRPHDISGALEHLVAAGSPNDAVATLQRRPLTSPTPAAAIPPHKNSESSPAGSRPTQKATKIVSPVAAAPPTSHCRSLSTSSTLARLDLQAARNHPHWTYAVRLTTP